MERYEAYKDSGVKWIGQIPTSWEEGALAHFAEILGSGATPSTDNELYYDGNISWLQVRDLGKGRVATASRTITDKALEDFSVIRVYRAPFLAIAMYASIGSISFVEQDSAVNQAICAIANGRMDLRYLYYHLLSWEPYLLADGQGGTQKNISQQHVRKLRIIAPALNEQQAIADYLDAKTAEIDALVADCEREVGLLQEYRKAVISEAVTKGLDPDAPMKDSGIEWIGEIPATWEVRRIKSFLKLRDERNSLPLEEVNLISLYTDLGVVQHSELEKTTGNKAVTADGYKVVCENDIVVNIILCWMGAIGMSNYNGVTSPAYDVYIPNDEVDPRYFHYLFRTSLFGGECYKAGRGIMAMRWRTYSDQFKAITVPFPSLGQQTAIADMLDDLTEQIGSLIEAKQVMADKLREYRRSLISEAVTGKFKVSDSSNMDNRRDKPPRNDDGK